MLIRAVSLGHPPPVNFVLVTMGATGVLLVGWRAVLYTLFPNKPKNKNDMYKQGSAFELFEVIMRLSWPMIICWEFLTKTVKIRRNLRQNLTKDECELITIPVISFFFFELKPSLLYCFFMNQTNPVIC